METTPILYPCHITGSCEETIIVEEPDNPINDIADFLECFDTAQEATVTIYVNQPVANSDETFTTGADKAGHAFVSISQSNIIRVLGFYPEGNASPFSPEHPPIFGNNAGDNFDVSISKTLSSFELSAIISETLNYQENYHLSYNNCTDYAATIAQLSGFEIGMTIGMWPGGSGLNPGNFGQDIRDMDLESGMSRNEDGGNAPANSGNCN